jgi:hypothetical protein
MDGTIRANDIRGMISDLNLNNIIAQQIAQLKCKKVIGSMHADYISLDTVDMMIDSLSATRVHIRTDNLKYGDIGHIVASDLIIDSDDIEPRALLNMIADEITLNDDVAHLSGICKLINQ